MDAITQDPRKEVHDVLAGNKIIPVLGTEFLQTREDVMALVAALHKGGSRIIEFVLREENAETVVNKDVFDEIKRLYPDMRIGVGTCVTPQDVELAHKAGAHFAVSANFDWQNIEKANELKLLYLPGVGTLGEFHRLINGDWKSKGKTVQELLGGEGIATLKVHPDAEKGALIPLINATIINKFQAMKHHIPFVGLVPSAAVQDGFTLNKIAEVSKQPHVTTIGGTYTYVVRDDKGGYRNLIQEKKWDDIAALTGYAMAVTHQQPAPELSAELRRGAGIAANLLSARAA